jgi:hypothetical protein
MKYEWNDTDEVTPKYSRRDTHPVATSSTINSTCASLGSRTGLHREILVASGLSSGTLAHCDRLLNSNYFVGDATLWDTLSSGISERKLKLEYKSDLILKDFMDSSARCSL